MGEWDLSWKDAQGDTHKGYNHIEKILDGKVIQENFADSAKGYYGKSWSTYNPKTNTWRQVWTDNQSAFLKFTGARYGDTMAFVMKPVLLNDVMTTRRMIFFNIQEDSFTWEWQSQKEGQQSWSRLWRINYTR